MITYHSNPSAVLSGVSQESISVPLLFIMFINEEAADSPVYVFIDDTKIIHVIRSHADFALLENYFLTGQTLATSFSNLVIPTSMVHIHLVIPQFTLENVIWI